MFLLNVISRAPLVFSKVTPLSPMLFVIVAEALHALMERAKQVRLLTGFVIENVDYEVTHLQSADDSMILLFFVMLRWAKWRLLNSF